jgi:hypothetical protein
MADVTYLFQIWMPSGDIISIPAEQMPAGYQVWGPSYDAESIAESTARNLKAKVTVQVTQTATFDAS